MSALDPQVLASLSQLQPEGQPKLDPDVAASLDRTSEAVDRRREYLRDKYAWGLVAPLSGTRLTYAKRAIQEVTDPTEREWLVGEVGRIAKMQEWAKRKDYDEAGAVGKRWKNFQMVGASFADAGTGMVEAASGMRDWLQGRGRSGEDVKFLRALEAAKQTQDPTVPKDAPLTLKAATGAAGMVPDMAAGLLANAAGGPAGMFGYWTARMQPERREDYLELGLDPTTSTLAGTAGAGAEAAIELLNIDPTGLTKPVAAPVKGAIRQGLKRAAEKVGSETLESLVKHPVARRAVGAGLEAAKRTALEATEEGLQGMVQEGGKYLASKASDKIPDRDPANILKEGYEQATQALPGLAVLSGVGGAAHVKEAADRFRRFTSGTKQARIEGEIMEHAAEDKTPSRTQWQQWGLPLEEGASQKQRRETMHRLAAEYRTLDQVRTVLSDATPTETQWQQWGLPVEEGETPEQRKAYLQQRLSEQQQVESESPALEEAPKVVQSEQSEAAVEPPAEVVQKTDVNPQAAEDTVGDVQEARMADRMAPAQHDMSVETEGTGESVGGRDVVRQIEQVWGIPIRSGRLGARRARGIYKTKPEVTRLAKGEEASPAVAAHEVAHHLDNSTKIRKGISPAARAELAKLDYDQKAARPSEGFAEFVRAYVTGSTAHYTDVDLKAVAPEFTQHFEAWLSQNPEVQAKIEATKSAVTQWRQAGAVGRVKGQISQTGYDKGSQPPLAERISEWKEFLYTRLKEEGRPVKRFTDEAIRRGYKPEGDTTPFEDYNALRQIGPHFAANAIEHGVFRLSGKMEKIGPSLSEALQEIEGDEDYENFVAWAYARHALESWSQGKNPGITLSDAQETVRRLQDPRYERAAKSVTDFNNGLIAVLADAGVIDADTAARVLSQYETYIPLERAKEGSRAGGGSRRMVDLSAAIKGRRGSGLQIIDPMEATLARAIRFYERAAKQVVINKLVETAKDVKGLGSWVEEVPPKVLATTFRIEDIKGQLASALEEAGLDPDEVLADIDPMTALTIWKPDLMKVHGQPIARVTVDGQPRFFQFRPELLEALGGLDTLQNLGIVTRVAKAFCGIMKLGATRLNPDFILSNAARDFQVFLMQGERGLTGAFDPARYASAYVVSELKRAAGQEGSPVVELFQKMGGELSTYTGLDRNRLRKGVRRALTGRQDYLATALNIAGTPEVASRLSEFAAVLHREGWLEKVKQGETPPMPILVRAINAAHDVTVDFRRMGSWGRYLNYWIPFFNARLEGLDKTVRTFKDKPARTALRVAMSTVPLALLYWWYRHDDDDYKERPEWQDGFWILKDSEGKPVVRIPKPQEWGLLDSGVERMMDAMYDKDPEAVERWGRQAFGTAMPGAYPAGITPLFESMFNYDSFRQRPIVSESLQKLQEPDQYYEYTSGLAKHAAKFLHEYSGGRISLSPAKIDHLANGLSGGLYRKATEPLEKAASGEPWTASDIPGLKGVTLRKDYAKSVDDFYQERERLSKAHESAKLRATPEENADRLHMMQSVSTLMTDMRKAARDLSPEERESTELGMVGLARAALGRAPLDRYPNPLANWDGLPKAVQDVVQDHIAEKAITASRAPQKRTEHGLKANAGIDAAAAYLRDFGVPEDEANRVMYARLRTQGAHPDTAKKRVGLLRKRL